MALAAGCAPGEDVPQETAEILPAKADPTPTPRSNTQSAEITLPDGVTPALIEAGRAAYQDGICSSCHGPDGRGGLLAPDLTDDEWLHGGGSAEEIFWTIVAGVDDPIQHEGAMPPGGGSRMEDGQLRAVAAYTWSLAHQ